MNRLKKILLRFLVIPAIIYLVATTALSFLFKDKLVELVNEQVEKNIESKVEIGDINLSFLTAFPFAELRVKDLYIEDRWGKVLVQSDLLGVRIGLFSLLGEGIRIRSIILKGGKANVVYNKKGQANFEIFKERTQTESSEDSNFKLSIKKASLEDMALRYIDRKGQSNVSLKIDELVAGGDFTSSVFDLRSNADMEIRKLMIGGQSYLDEKDFEYDGAVNIDLEQKQYQFSDFGFAVDGGRFAITGGISETDEGMNLDLDLSAKEGDLGAIFSVLPDVGLGDLSSSGSFDFSASIKGPYTKTKKPAIEVEFGLNDGQIRTSYLGVPLKRVSFQSEFVSGHPKKSSKLSVDGFYAELDGQPLELDLNVLNLDDPLIDLRADAQIPGRALSPLMGEDVDAAGLISMKNLKVNGKLRDMKSRSRIHKVDASGRMVLEAFEVSNGGKEIVFEEGEIAVKDNGIRISDLMVKGSEIEFEGKGQVKNLLTVLADPSNKSNYIDLNFDLSGDELNIDNVLTAFGASGDEEEEIIAENGAEEEPSDNLFSLRSLKGHFGTSFNNITYGSLSVEQFKGALDFRKGDIKIKGDLKAMEGSLKLDGQIDALADRPSLHLKIDCEDVNASEMFRQMDDFGQDMITKDNVTGTLHSKMVLILPFEKNGDFDMDNVKVYAGIGIEKGELKGIEMLEDFSKVIHLEDLRKIRFVNMENWLEISNGQVYIPAMFIQSNAINVKLSGQQGFDETIDFNFKVNAGQVIAEKVKKHDISLKPIAAKENGFFNLYFHIFGDLDDMDYKTSKRIVSENFVRSEARKEDVKYALERAFGPIDLIKEPSQWADLGDFELMEDMEEDVEYIDGF